MQGKNAAFRRRRWRRSWGSAGRPFQNGKRTRPFDVDVKEIQEIIDKTSEEAEEKIDWTKAWGKKYPILVRYQKEVNVPGYARRLAAMLDELRQEYSYSEQDAMLVLKDILYTVWKSRKS